MEYVDEFRDPDLATALVSKINRTMAGIEKERKPLQIMEVCGGHTHTLFKYGIAQLLSDDIDFVHGPGCPVCVLPQKRLDQVIAIAEQPGTILCTFGDAMRVPGSSGSLLDARARGCDVRMVYSPMDALKLAEQNLQKKVVFFALGFETTMPATAMTLQAAKCKQVTNFWLFCQHITIMPTLTALLSQDDVRIDGFLLPGHLSIIIGTKPYQPLADDFHKPCVVTGFEPLDMLQALDMLVDQLKEQRCEIENQYSRVVVADGNSNALQAMAEVFTGKQESEWRGLGNIPHSGVQLTPAYRDFDAEVHFQPQATNQADPQNSRCGDVLAGRCKPTDCPLFGRDCTPDTAVGALMVSSEGACAAYYQYNRH